MTLNGFNNYNICPDKGTIYSFKINDYIKPKLKKDGYFEVILYDDNGVKHYWRLHRLIWTVVNGEIPEGMQVNHIDENKTNNCISNLNLMTAKENCNWGTRNKRITASQINHKLKSNPVLAIQNGNVKMYFPSTMDAQRLYQMNNALISECALGKRKTHKGYQWQYMDDYLADWWEEEYMN